MDTKIQKALAGVADGSILSKDAQAASGVSHVTFYKIKKELGIKRPDGARKKITAAADAKRAGRKLLAEQVNEGRLTFDEALAVAQIHRTTLMRLLQKYPPAVPTTKTGNAE